MSGDVEARHNLGAAEHNAGNNQRAFKHFLIAAGTGHPKLSYELMGITGSIYD